MERNHLLADGDPDEAVQWNLGDNMTHSYYLDTVTNIRSTPRIITDILFIAMSVMFILAALGLQRSKGLIGNFHETWTNKDTEYFIP